tara:strand:+ start:12927 stop:13298 length:372 start_codon:yes stop_codon:yes gene_type:complete
MKNRNKLCLLALSTIFLFSCRETSDKSKKIAEVIKNSCNCEIVTSVISSYGITISRENPSNVGERYELKLSNCDSTNYEAEVNAIQTALKTTKLCNDVFILLEFKDDTVTKDFVIDNCAVLVK